MWYKNSEGRFGESGRKGVELFNDKAEKGWIYTTTAKEIYGVDLVYENIYRYKVADMLKHVEKNKHRAKPVKNGAYMLWVSKTEPFIEKLQ